MTLFHIWLYGAAFSFAVFTPRSYMSADTRLERIVFTVFSIVAATVWPISWAGIGISVFGAHFGVRR